MAAIRQWFSGPSRLPFCLPPHLLILRTLCSIMNSQLSVCVQEKEVKLSLVYW